MSPSHDSEGQSAPKYFSNLVADPETYMHVYKGYR